MKEKVKALLGLNLPNSVVASATGLPEEQISAFLSEEDFRKEVQELRLKTAVEGAERDSAYNAIEDGLLNKLREAIDNGFIVKPMEVARILQIINAAKRRTTPVEMAQQNNRTVLQLVMPVSIAAKFVVNQKSQVVEVEGRTIATMPASGVVAALEEKQKQEQKNAEAHKMDEDRARERLEGLQKLSHLPVHAVL